MSNTTDELIAKAAEAIENCDKPYSSEHLARAVLTAVLPSIRNGVIEECADVVEDMGEDKHGDAGFWLGMAESAIRSLKSEGE